MISNWDIDGLIVSGGAEPYALEYYIAKKNKELTKEQKKYIRKQRKKHSRYIDDTITYMMAIEAGFVDDARKRSKIELYLVGAMRDNYEERQEKTYIDYMKKWNANVQYWNERLGLGENQERK